MKMPSKIKQKWLKALRSGEYGQTRSVLTDGDGNFCCLGVLQHCVSGGRVECWSDTGAFKGLPSREWLSDNGIELVRHNTIDDSVMNDNDISKLVRMNDGIASDFNPKVRKSFKGIANWIEANIETTD